MCAEEDQKLHVADAVSHFEADGGVFGGTELLADIAVIVGGGDCPHDGGIVEFLRFVDFVAARAADGMEVADVLDVAGQGADDVAFPYLHADRILGAKRIRLLGTDSPSISYRVSNQMVPLLITSGKARIAAASTGRLIKSYRQ